MTSNMTIRVRNVPVLDVQDNDQEEYSQAAHMMSLEDVCYEVVQVPSLPQRALGRQTHCSSSCSALPERDSMQLLGTLTETCKLQIDVQQIISLDDPCQSYRLAETQCGTSPLREPAPEPPTLSAIGSTPRPDVEDEAGHAKTKELKGMQKVLHKLDGILAYIELNHMKNDLHDLENILVDLGDDVSKPSDNNTTPHRAVLERLKGHAKKLHGICTTQSRGASPSVEVSHDYVESRPSCHLRLQPACTPLAASQPLSDHHKLSMSESLQTPTRTLSPSRPCRDAVVKTVHDIHLTQVSCPPEGKWPDKLRKVAQTSGAKWSNHLELSYGNQVAPVTVSEVLEKKKVFSSNFTPPVVPLSQCSSLQHLTSDAACHRVYHGIRMPTLMCGPGRCHPVVHPMC
jgi:hypothetical protein